jgi:L,D-peptidoglycan transpeptidase YkuD (ErfK/YbiS/YcfS/YnhG family)
MMTGAIHWATVRLRRLCLVCLALVVLTTGAALAGPAHSLALARADSRAATSLTLSATPNVVDYAGSATLSGRLWETDTGAAVPGAALDVGSSTDGVTWSELTTLTSDAGGGFSLQVTPVAAYGATQFRVVFPGNDALQAAEAQVTVGSRAALSAPAVPRSVGRGSPFVTSGVLQPRHPAGAPAVTIQCYRLESGSWILRATATAAVQDQADASLYRVAAKLPAAGAWRLRAYHADAAHAPSWSPWSSRVTVTAGSDAPIWDRDGVTTIPERMRSRLGSRQLVVVTGARLGARTGTLRLFNYRDGEWLRALAVPVRLGEHGLTNGLTRHAGSRTTPTGIWRLPGYCFGTHPKAPHGVKLRYRHITSHSWWSAENNATYNTWVETSRSVYGEHLADYPGPYEFAVSSGYNARPNPCVYGRGTAIFLHVVHPGYSAGCIMLARADMILLLKLLDPARRPACAVGTTRTGIRTSIYAY